MSNEAWRLRNGEDRDERGHIRWRCEICKALGHAADECDQADCDTCLNEGLDNRGHWAGSPLCPAYSAKRRAIEAELMRSRRGEEAAAKAAGGGGGFADAKAADVDYAGAAIGGTEAEPLGIIPPPPVPPPFSPLPSQPGESFCTTTAQFPVSQYSSTIRTAPASTSGANNELTSPCRYTWQYR